MAARTEQSPKVIPDETCIGRLIAWQNEHPYGVNDSICPDIELICDENGHPIGVKNVEVDPEIQRRYDELKAMEQFNQHL